MRLATITQANPARASLALGTFGRHDKQSAELSSNGASLPHHVGALRRRLCGRVRQCGRNDLIRFLFEVGG